MYTLILENGQSLSVLRNITCLPVYVDKLPLVSAVLLECPNFRSNKQRVVSEIFSGSGTFKNLSIGGVLFTCSLLT